MAKYVVLINWTDQGIQNAKETVARSEQARELAATMGVTIETLLWTMGKHDIVAIADCPDNATAAKFCAKIGGLGNLRTETLPAFTAEEVAGIIG